MPLMPGVLRGRCERLIGVSLIALVAACGESGVSAPLAPGSVVPVAATGLSAVAGQALANPIEVRVLSTDQQPLANATVTFAVTAGAGAVDPASAVTDNNGVARTRWTLGRTAGTNTLTATAGSGVAATITATGVAGRAATVAAAAGDAQAAPVGTAVSTAPGVRVADANNNPVAGVPVTFAVVSGGGRVTDAVRTTNAQGLASVGAWTLGTTAGAQQLSATVGESGVANNPVLFGATALAGAASQLTALSATTQTGTAGLQVAAAPSVRVTDANGNPVSGVQVTFSVTQGGGSLSVQVVNSNLQGVATAGNWLLGTTAGANQVTATITGASPVTFSATGSAGAATQMTVSAGNGQRAQINRSVPVAPAVLVRDAFNNPVAGVIVTFSIGQGGGSIVSGRVTTDAAGIAAVGAWFMGDTPGNNTLIAASTGLSSITFTATADPGRPATMVANSATLQAGTAGQPAAEVPSVIIRDIGGNPVPGVPVTFAVTAGNGTVTGGQATTNASGIASASAWTLGTTAGTNTVTATSTGLPTVTFSATGAAGAPTTVVIAAGNNQAAFRDSIVPVRPAVRVTDANGNNVPGVAVTFAVTSGGGSVTGATVNTDNAGIATVGNWVLGSLAQQQLTATVTGTNITGNPVTFTALSATQIQVTGFAVTQTNGAPFQVTVTLRDAGGQLVPLAATVNLAIGGGSGAITPTAVTLSNGTLTTNVTVTGATPTPAQRTINATISNTVLVGTSALITFN